MIKRGDVVVHWIFGQGIADEDESVNSSTIMVYFEKYGVSIMTAIESLEFEGIVLEN